MPDKNAREKARDILNRAQTAVGEIAYETPKSEMPKNIARCGDPQGAYADHLYNDPDTLEGFIGDWIFDASSDWGMRAEIIGCLKERAHQGMLKALSNIESRWQKELTNGLR